MRRMFLGVVIAAVDVLLVSVPLIAHHVAAALDTGKEVTMKGTVTEWIWSNLSAVRREGRHGHRAELGR